MTDPVSDLLRFIDRSPTPYHAVAESSRRLAAAGFRALGEEEVWELSPGDARYVVRGGSLLAFIVGERAPADAGFHFVGAHTDSPNLRVKPLPDVSREGVHQLAVEPYGGVLLHTWLDRDLSLAGRATVALASGLATVLVDFRRPLLRVPNLAIHLQRELVTEGLKLNAQAHAVPVLGLAGGPPLAELLAAELAASNGPSVAGRDVVGFDLMAYDVQPAARAGSRGELLFAPRLDNLTSCHAAVSALAGAREKKLPAWTNGIVLHDHEEVGSRSAEGAAGTLLATGLERIADGVKGGAKQAFARAAARSLLISADMAHAVHPNYADKHEPGHRPRLGGGPVLKVNSGQAYASDGPGIGYVTSLARSCGFEPQHFVTRSDLACGSTIGPIAAAQVGIRTVDLGNPMLSMHSCRELAAADDVAPLHALLGAFFGTKLAWETA
jgi:aspartyl aminopeptidase